ncbi:MAG: hypothetical protein U5K43_10095 [Halofilum sp. (in: g-proteobacteria)]|nr:hypothetical protein [Halofilum sp. (in: g-proteobacteria)]
MLRINPGPILFVTGKELVYTVFAGDPLANALMIVIGMGVARGVLLHPRRCRLDPLRGDRHSRAHRRVPRCATTSPTSTSAWHSACSATSCGATASRRRR